MKKIKLLFFVFITTITLHNTYAQQQWKFHIAFEDATGAKDTIWLIYDTAATSGVDVQFGEAPISLNYSVFNVFTGNPNGDTTKVSAVPYSYFPNHGVEVHALNYQYPLTISWDTSLFHASYLPYMQGYFNIARIDNDYFFLVNNHPSIQGFDMFLDNQVVAPSFLWGSQSQFPMNFHLSYDPSVSINKVFSSSQVLNIYPNPFSKAINISSLDNTKEITVISLEGKEIYKEEFPSPCRLMSHEISLSHLNSGLYIIKIINQQNQTYYEKLIKNF